MGINETFEPMQVQHNKHPIWVARAVAPRYLFHTGKSRWCISKQQDDGHRCWAYIQDSGNSSDPSQCTGAWQCVDDNGTWAADNGVKCTTVQPANDMFVKLRMTLDGDMRKYGLVESSDLKCLWKRLDYNGNNVVSLAEIDKMAVELVSGGTWPAFMNNKPALMRAYKKTILVDGDGDAWVEKPEFHALLLNLFWFGKLFEIFRSIDTGADRRIELASIPMRMRRSTRTSFLVSTVGRTSVPSMVTPRRATWSSRGSRCRSSTSWRRRFWGLCKTRRNCAPCGSR